jgi:hypothetical protein
MTLTLFDYLVLLQLELRIDKVHVDWQTPIVGATPRTIASKPLTFSRYVAARDSLKPGEA